MMRSMFSSVSGLKSHQTKMDVIGNNIANVNTVGFKSSRATFQEIFSQTLSSGSAPDSTTGRGGTNPMQVGLGMKVDSISTDMTQGSVQRTESPTDLSIEGEGFFIVRSGNQGSFSFTRAGNFIIDKAGNLVTSSGKNVYGWLGYKQTDDGYEFNTEDPIEPINLYEYGNENRKIISGKSTTEAVLSGNLNAASSAVLGSGQNANPQAVTDADGDGYIDVNGNNIKPDFTVPITVYDSLGNSYKLNVQFWKTYVDTTTAGSPKTQWYYNIVPEKSNVTAASGASGTTGGTGTTNASDAEGYLCFDKDGKLIADNNFKAQLTINVTPPAESGAGSFQFNLDLSKLTQYADDSSVKPARVDGYAPGTLVTFSIGEDGIITGVYDNGREQPLGMIALATFDNPAGLEKVGTNEYMQTTNSGDFSIAHKPRTDGAGSLLPGTLEMSNVDLASQFTEMIITQRGFQANSRVLTTADEILQELANLKR